MNYTKSWSSPATVTTATGNVWEGLLTIEQEIIMVRSEYAVLPDPNWRHVDSNGHAHVWAGKEIPTLNHGYEHFECDGVCGDPGCEGYHRSLWTCLVCGERVEPAYVPDYQARNEGVAVDGMKSWRIDAKGYDTPPEYAMDMRATVDVTVTTEDRVYTGKVGVGARSVQSMGDYLTWEAELYGASELAEQP